MESRGEIRVSQKLFDEAVRLEADGQLEPALALWRQLAEASPTKNVFLRLGSLTRTLGLLDEAEQAFKRAVAINEHSGLALTALGSLALDRGDSESAIGYLRRAC